MASPQHSFIEEVDLNAKEGELLRGIELADVEHGKRMVHLTHVLIRQLHHRSIVFLEEFRVEMMLAAHRDDVSEQLMEARTARRLLLFRRLAVCCQPQAQVCA